MTRRATERRYAIIGALHEHGPQFVSDLSRITGMGIATLYADLVVLEEQEGLVVGEFEHRDDDQPRRRRYRLTTTTERHRRGTRRRVRKKAPARKPAKARVLPVFRPHPGMSPA